VGRVLIMALLMLQWSVRRHVPRGNHIATLQTLHRFDPIPLASTDYELILGGIDGRLWQASSCCSHMAVALVISCLSADEIGSGTSVG